MKKVIHRSNNQNNRFQEGPPSHVLPLCTVVGPCENDLVVKSIIEKVPYFNAPVYFENKQAIGKVDEIFGPVKSYVIFD